MCEEFIVKVGRSFISEIQRGDFILGDVNEAMQFNRSEAESLATTARWRYAGETVFVAHKDRPFYEAESEDEPREFIVCIGRRYLTRIKNGWVMSAFTVDLAKRFTRQAAEHSAEQVCEKEKKSRVYVAHERTPFIPFKAPARTPDETDGE